MKIRVYVNLPEGSSGYIYVKFNPSSPPLSPAPTGCSAPEVPALSFEGNQQSQGEGLHGHCHLWEFANIRQSWGYIEDIMGISDGDF
jgi:hypothetical protein